ncbi:hypothetical protein LCGC14_2073490 [marine sediment metagenome]|uniref:Uncharacterized protein n=1 Tax=marine sediment metagenome TaxID=412755 RepID=A0A0F9EHJ5_9ZZZZ
MNVSEMMLELSQRLEDENEEEFDDSFRLLLLNNAQDKFTHLINKKFLTELETKDTITHSSGAIALTGVGIDSNATSELVLKGGEGILEVTIASNGKVATKLGISDLRQKESRFSTPTQEWPVYYISGNKIYVLPIIETSWVVRYLKQPDELRYTFDVASGDENTILIADRVALGLSGTQDAYKYAVLYRTTAASDDYQYYIITASANAAGYLQIQLSPDAGNVFTSADNVAFITHGFDTLYLEGVEPEINEGFHSVMLDLAEAAGWRRSGEISRWEIAYKSAVDEIAFLNGEDKIPSGMGRDLRQRSRNV